VTWKKVASTGGRQATNRESFEEGGEGRSRTKDSRGGDARIVGDRKVHFPNRGERSLASAVHLCRKKNHPH